MLIHMRVRDRIRIRTHDRICVYIGISDQRSASACAFASTFECTFVSLCIRTRIRDGIGKQYSFCHIRARMRRCMRVVFRRRSTSMRMRSTRIRTCADIHARQPAWSRQRAYAYMHCYTFACMHACTRACKLRVHAFMHSVTHSRHVTCARAHAIIRAVGQSGSRAVGQSGIRAGIHSCSRAFAQSSEQACRMQGVDAVRSASTRRCADALALVLVCNCACASVQLYARAHALGCICVHVR
jgi:hypothetical protein